MTVCIGIKDKKNHCCYVGADSGDGHTIITTETLDEAKHELQLRINREKKKKCMTYTKFWVMKQTCKYEKVYEVEGENEYIRTDNI